MNGRKDLSIRLTMSIFLLVGVVGNTNLCKGYDSYFIVDDMESYTPLEIPNNNIFDTWVDGMGDCLGSGNGTEANVFESPGMGVGGSGFVYFDDIVLLHEPGVIFVDADAVGANNGTS